MSELLTLEPPEQAIAYQKVGNILQFTDDEGELFGQQPDGSFSHLS